jgi:adenylate cyclase
MITQAEVLQGKILIVDDLKANVLLLEKMLQGGGYQRVSSTTDPTRVRELHLHNRYDLIMLDLQMPGMNGFQVMEELKQIETSGYLPVLVITVQSDQNLLALRAGAKDFLSKPLNLAEVLLRVYNMLEVRLLHQKTLSMCEELLAEKAQNQALSGERVRIMAELDKPRQDSEQANRAK